MFLHQRQFFNVNIFSVSALNINSIIQRQQHMPFTALGLHQHIVKNITQLGYEQPTPIQQQAIPAVLAQRDLIAIAQTGTGKTASFVLPILQLMSVGEPAKPNNIRALIIAPTRELAAQVALNVDNYSVSMNVSSSAIFGGVRIEPQLYELSKGVDILVATPGRLLDLHQQNAIHFDQLEVLVLDEADRMLDLGFVDDITRIHQLLPKQLHRLMFSATFSKAIKALAKTMLHNPVMLEIAPQNNHIEAIQQILHPVDQARKSELLQYLMMHNDWSQILVFTRTKRGADTLRDELESKDISAESIHANRTQRARTLALDGFRNGNIKVLVATDIASRGIDINELPCVINYDLPFVPEDYVHRIGRTGRASSNGLAISFYCEEETKQLKSIERLLKRQFKRTVIEGFAPTPKPKAAPVDEDIYGNFEADDSPRRKGKSTKRGRRRK